MIENELILVLRTMLLLAMTGTALLLAPEGPANVLPRVLSRWERSFRGWLERKEQRANGKPESFCEIDMTKFE